MRRYVLSDEKTFASLFHPDKDAILRLIDAFIRKDGKCSAPWLGDLRRVRICGCMRPSVLHHATQKHVFVRPCPFAGKYAIPGYGHKLGLLLYGPPGTGKTSLIKVRLMAQPRCQSSCRL